MGERDREIGGLGEQVQKQHPILSKVRATTTYMYHLNWFNNTMHMYMYMYMCTRRSVSPLALFPLQYSSRHGAQTYEAQEKGALPPSMNTIKPP